MQSFTSLVLFSLFPFYFFFFVSQTGLLLPRDVWLFPTVAPPKCSPVMSLILFILYGCSVLGGGEGELGGEERCEERRRKRWRRRAGRRMGEEEIWCWRKKIFSAAACIMNERALCLKLQPPRLTSRFAGQSGGLVIRRPGPRLFSFRQWMLSPGTDRSFDPVEKQITLCASK